MHKFKDNVLYTIGIPPQATATTTEIDGTGVDMAKFANYAAIISVKGATQYGAALTANIAESTDNSTFSDTYLATVTIASVTTDAIDIVECRAAAMTKGYRYLRCEVTDVGTLKSLSALNVRFNPRFAPVQ
jgi:hypothetical protein